MASKAKRKYKKQDAKSMIDSLDPNVCVFCKKQEDNEDFFGKLIRKCDLTVHYFCMLFSSGLGQGGKTEDDGVFGFLPQDIIKEVSRGRRLRCTYCKQKGATVGCVVGSCRRVFHFNCGRESGTLHQFYDSYRSYCEEHRPRQNNSVSDRLSFYGTANTLCAICMMSVEARASNETLRAPCCRNSWFHRTCIQRHSTAAGLHFFKCPLCNNKEMFQAEMLKFGIYLPDQDAAWEREPNAFNELLERYTHCDAARCKCVHGRDYNKDGGKWEIIVCDWCGSTGTHVGCHSLHKIGSNDVCADCKVIDEKSRKETGLPKRKKGKGGKHTPKKTDNESNLDENKAKSEYPGSSGLLRKATPPLKRKYAAKKKVSPGTVLRLSYEETDDNVVVDGDESDDDMVLSELTKKDQGGQTDRKRKKTFRYKKYAKKLKNSRSDQCSECSLDKTESDFSFNLGNRFHSPTSHRRKTVSVVSATVTKETESMDVARKARSLSTQTEQQSIEDLRKKKRKLKYIRKYDPFRFSSRKNKRKSRNRFHNSVSSITSQDTSSSVVTLEQCCGTDDSQFGDSESNIFASESEMDASFSSQCKYKKNHSLLVKGKSNVFPSVSTPKSSGALERKLSLRSSPSKLSGQNLKSFSISALSPVKNFNDTRCSADSSGEDTVKMENKSKISLETSSDENKNEKKLILDQAGKEKGKTKRKYNKLKKDSNQMSIKLWLHGSPKENEEKTNTCTANVKSLVKGNMVNKEKSLVFPGGEQRKTLVIKWKGKRFIVRRTIKDNITIRKTLEIDGKSPEKLRVKPLTREKLGSNQPVKSTSSRELRIFPKVSVEQGKDCTTPTKQLRSTTKKIQQESPQKNGGKITQSKSDCNSSVNRKKNDTSKDLSSTASPSKFYPTRKAVSNQKTNISSLINFPVEVLYTSPKKNKNGVNTSIEDTCSRSPNSIKIKSDVDSSVVSVSDTSALARDMSDSVVILDANDNITHVATSEQEQDRFESRKLKTEEDVIILHDNSLDRSKVNGVNGAELSPSGDTYRCLILDFGGKDLTDSDFQSAQYVNISLENKNNDLSDKTAVNSSDTVSTLSSCLLKSFDKKGIQHLNVVVSDTA